MTWSTPCTAKDPQGRACGLAAGHPGDHQLAEFAPAPAKTSLNGIVKAVIILVIAVIVINFVTRLIL